MKILKWLLGLVLLLAVVLVAGGWMLSPKFSVSRSVTVAAPPEKVYALVADPRRWKEWSVWNRRDPAMQITYSGPPEGAGAAWAWVCACAAGSATASHSSAISAALMPPPPRT